MIRKKKSAFTSAMSFMFLLGLLTLDKQLLNVPLIIAFGLIAIFAGYLGKEVVSKVKFSVWLIVLALLSLFAESRMFRNSQSLRDNISYAIEHKNSCILVYSLFSQTYWRSFKKIMVQIDQGSYREALKTTLFYRHELKELLDEPLLSKKIRTQDAPDVSRSQCRFTEAT